MGKPTYDELHDLFMDCELQRENLLLENDELKTILSRIAKLIDDYERMERILGAGHPRFPLYKLCDIMRYYK